MGVKKEIQGGGYKFVKINPDAKNYVADTKRANLPANVDLRPFMTTVENQGQTNSCTANAVVSAYEYLFKRFKKQSYDISRLFVYYNARVYTDQQGLDNGSVVQYAMDSLKKAGACSEKTWAFGGKDVVVQQPTKQAYEEGKRFLIDEILCVPLKLEAWKKTLADGYPIVFGTTLFKSFPERKSKGIVPMPTPDEAGRKDHGRHAMLCVGYSDKDKMFIIRNSWGADWADKGYCYIPYNYLMNELWTREGWIMTRAKKVPNVQKAWSKVPKSVVNNGKGLKKSDVTIYHPRDYASIPSDVFQDEEEYEYEEKEAPFAAIMDEYELEEGEDEDWEDNEDIEDEDEEFEASEEDEEEDYEDTEFDEEDDYEYEEFEDDEEESEDEESEDEESEDEESEELEDEELGDEESEEEELEEEELEDEESEDEELEDEELGDEDEELEDEELGDEESELEEEESEEEELEEEESEEEESEEEESEEAESEEAESEEEESEEEESEEEESEEEQ